MYIVFPQGIGPWKSSARILLSCTNTSWPQAHACYLGDGKKERSVEFLPGSCITAMMVDMCGFLAEVLSSR